MSVLMHSRSLTIQPAKFWTSRPLLFKRKPYSNQSKRETTIFSNNFTVTWLLMLY